jgi:hypothetical protein
MTDSAEEWTANPANVLRRRHGDPVAVPELSLNFLGTTYGDDVEADPADYIECTNRHYDDQYFALRRDNPAFRNVVYARSVDRGDELWLQYWFWYFLNDYELAFGIDVHEGDPSFIEAGYHETDFYDLCDGKQPAKSPLQFVDVTAAPGWLTWPGHWGSTRAKYAGPDAPCHHVQWADPRALLATARAVHQKDPPGAPHVTVRPRDGRLRVQFDTSRCEAPPRRVIVTINSRDEKSEPPRALRIPVTLFDPPNPVRALVRRISSSAGRFLYAIRRALHIDHGRRSDAPLV